MTRNRKMTSREVRASFKRWWRERCAYVPAYRNDKPAMRQAFCNHVDDLARDGRISERVAFNVTLD